MGQGVWAMVAAKKLKCAPQDWKKENDEQNGDTGVIKVDRNTGWDRENDNRQSKITE